MSAAERDVAARVARLAATEPQTPDSAVFDAGMARLKAAVVALRAAEPKGAVPVAAIHPRLAFLCRLVRRQGGEWTPARVGRAYTAGGYDAPKSTTHKADLKSLHRMGVLDRREQPGRTHYVPSRQTTPGGTR
jgi:hypothetical protein